MKIVDRLFILKQRCSLKIDELSAETGLTPREMRALESLSIGETVSGNEISRRMELSPSRGSRIVESLIRKGCLLRETNPFDRRAIHLSLSEHGAGQKRKIETLKNDCEKLLRSHISGDQIDRVCESLEILMKAW